MSEMKINLKKGDKIDLIKKAPRLIKVSVGLGWQPVKSGFLGSLFGASGEIDLDASCVMLDGAGEMVDTVWFRQLQSRDGSVKHSGDNRTGEGDGDDETITVDLQKLSSNVNHLFFVINSFSGQTFDKIGGAHCRLLDAVSGKEMAAYHLTEKKNVTACIMAKVSKDEKGGWIATALGEWGNAKIQSDLIEKIQGLI